MQVTILVRRPDDEILLLASDGLWDVLNNQEACTLAKRCLRRARQRGASRQSAARIAATVLTRAAVDRGSRDNVTVSTADTRKPRSIRLKERLQEAHWLSAFRASWIQVARLAYLQSCSALSYLLNPQKHCKVPLSSSSWSLQPFQGCAKHCLIFNMKLCF